MSTTTTTVVIADPSAGGTEPWKYTLFSCCQNGVGDCCAKACCSNCAWGKAMELAFGENCMLYCLGMAFCPGIMQIVSCLKRANLRQKYNLVGGAIDDFLACYFCSGCHYMQMIHEIEARENQVITCLGGVQGGGGGGGATVVVTTTTSS